MEKDCELYTTRQDSTIVVWKSSATNSRVRHDCALAIKKLTQDKIREIKRTKKGK